MEKQLYITLESERIMSIVKVKQKNLKYGFTENSIIDGWAQTNRN